MPNELLLVDNSLAFLDDLVIGLLRAEVGLIVNFILQSLLLPTVLQIFYLLLNGLFIFEGIL